MHSVALALCLALCVGAHADIGASSAAAPPAVADEYPAGSHSLTITDSTFADIVANQNVLIFFHGTTCENSAGFVPKFERIAEQFAGNLNVRFANVDCDRSAAELCRNQKVEAYEIYLYPAASTRDPRVRFVGLRTVDGLARFVLKHLGDDALDGTALDVPRSMAAIIELTDETVRDHLAVGEHFVEFYAPWCGHCQRLAPTWDELATAVEPDQTVSISKVDCTQFRPICVEYEVKGYPTLLWIVDGKRVHKYAGARSFDELRKYTQVTSEVAKPSATVVEAPEDGAERGGVTHESGVLVLNSGNFEHVLQRGVTLVKFYAPWCGHCKRLAPRWEEVAAKFVGQPKVKIAKVDCTELDNKELCGEQDVNGFPTIFVYRDGRKIQEYVGNRSLEDLYEFAVRHSSRDEL